MKKRLKLKKKPLIIAGVILTIILAIIITIAVMINKHINSIPYRLRHTNDYIEKNYDRYIAYQQKYNISVLDEVIYYVNNDIDLIEDIEYLPNYRNIFGEKYYIDENKERYIKYLFNNQDKSTSSIVEAVNANNDFEYYSTNYKADTSKEYLILVNKYYVLEKDFAPKKLVNVAPRYGYSKQMEEVAYNKMVEMFKAAVKAGVEFMVTSPYRSYSSQESLYNGYVKSYGKDSADTFSARAGHSEHQTGLAMDVASATGKYDNFADSPEYEWLINNCYKYGFILRYPKGKEAVTGYTFEPWHYRYVGEEVATYIHENKITFDEYYEYFVK